MPCHSLSYCIILKVPYFFISIVLQISLCLNKLGVEENFLDLIKDIYKKHTANIIPNNEISNAFPLKERTKQGFLFS